VGFLDKLKTIGIEFPKLKNLLHINITTNIDNSTKIEGSTILINPEKFNRKQKQGLKEIIRATALEESGAILNQNYTPTVDEALKALPDIQTAAQKYINIIPPSDIPLLRACLFLKTRHDNGGSVSEIKEQIARTYGTRGRNLANLCSAGYLEDWFWPLYEILLKTNPDNPETAKAVFRIIYNQIVSELPWTEFVSIGCTAATVTKHIVKKMNRNLQNGVRFINIHGLGEKNVRKIILILPDIQKQTDSEVTKTTRESNRIFIRLEIRQQLQIP